jgi:hypothetical protein
MNNANSNILRTLGKNEVFYFYTSIGCYTGQSAGSLEELEQKIKDIDEKSLEFHLFRGDFENWISSTIGDARLAADTRLLQGQRVTGNDLRTRLSLLVSVRLKELKSTSLPKAKKQAKKKTNI